MSFSEIGFSPSTLEVDYDKNVTELYRCITDQDWERTVEICKSDPEQAKTWVVRHYDDDDDGEGEEGEIMWRFLPLHSACARQPPISVVASLLRAYPDAAKCQDDQGMYPLHYACGNQATRDVVRILLVSFPDAAKKQDPRMMLPIHYIACWGPSSVSVVDMLLVANPNVAEAKDSEGNTPLDLAREGEYPEKDSVVAVLQKWLSDTNKAPNETQEPVPSTKGPVGRFKKEKNVTALAAAAELKHLSSSSGSRSEASSANSRSRNSRKIPPKYKQMRRQEPPHNNEEEKKEEEDFSYPPLPSHEVIETGIPQAELKKVQDELATVQAEKAALENKLVEANMKRDLQDGEIVELQEALADAKLSSSREQRGAQDASKELEKTKTKLKGCNEELKGLRLTMVDMMEEHDSLVQRANSMNDRLASLSVSLEALMTQQKGLAKLLKNRSDQNQRAYQKRKESMRVLLEMEENNEDEDAALELKLKKQTKEMEALAAMIAAARD